MKTIIFASLLATILLPAAAQQVIIKGTLRCMNNGIATSTRGAVNIIIIPSFNPKAAVATTTTPQGFFQINTGWEARQLRDKDVTLYIITKCSSCKNVERIFISEDLDKRNTDPDKMYVTIKGWKVLENCKQTELPGLMSEKLLDSARRLPGLPVDGTAPGSPAVASAGFLNLFQKLATTALITGASGTFPASIVTPGKIKFGQFMAASAITNTDNTGFNFSPARNLSEAVFFNAAAIGNNGSNNNISLLSNLKNNVKVSGYKRMTRNFYLGAGGIYTKQDEFRRIGYDASFDPNVPFTVYGNHPEKLQEFAAFLALVYAIQNNLSVGLTIKSIWQQFNNPGTFMIQQAGDGSFTNKYADDAVKIQHFDVDFSANYKLCSFLQLGISVLNLTGSKLYADVFLKNTAPAYINQRTYGIGVSYKYGRLNAGIDALATDKKLFDVALGLNYVPFNNALIAAGYAFKQQSFSVAFRLKYFKIAYVNDNNGMINDIKVGKNKIFNGKIYSGLVFDF